MKLCSGKRRGFSKSVSEIQALARAAWWCQIRKDCSIRSGLFQCCTSLVLHATNRWYCASGRMKFKFLGAQALPPGLQRRRVTEWSRIASISLMRAASLSRVGRRPLRPVLKHGPRSLTCVRVIGCTKLKGAVKANLGMICNRRNPGASIRPRSVWSSRSTHVGTRKMVNYAWPG